MKRVLNGSFRWLIRTEDGLLKEPMDRWGDRHVLCQKYISREKAIEHYCALVNTESDDIPGSLILVEEHSIGWNWDE